MKRQPRLRILGFLLCGGLCLLGSLALLTGNTAARYTTVWDGQNTAQAAAFDVEITPPAGVYTAEELPNGGRNEVEQDNAYGTEQVFTITNQGEVTVRIFPAVQAESDAAFTLDTTPFELKEGEAHQLVLVLEGGTTGLATTVENIDLQLTIEQVD